MLARTGAVLALFLSTAGCRREPTYYEDIAPILDASCVGCHRTGGIAPTPKLDTYERVRAAAKKVAQSVQSREMPPWGADDTGICHKWNGATWLPDEQVRLLVRWATGNAAPGNAAHRKVARREPQPFRSSGRALDTGGDYAPGLGPSAYRCFVIDPGLPTDGVVTAFRVVSSEPRSVAQITLYALDSDSAEAAASALDDADPGLGYTCYGSSRVDGARLVSSWSWGDPIQRLPAGIGVPLGRGRKVVVQIHYDPIATGLGVPTRTRLELELDDGARRASFLPVTPERFSLSPGAVFVETEGATRVARAVTVFGVAPRMHSLGKTMELERIVGGRRECVGTFDHWNFYHQRLFEYAEPLRLDAGDSLRVTCVYNTQSRARPTEKGETIDDEECLASLLVAD